MKIYEITESELVDPQFNHYGSSDSELSSRDVARQNIPSGIESWLDDYHDPHEVGLKNFDSNAHDAKTIYYTQMADLMGANPYMPVVYNIDRFGDENTARMEFKLERLVPANQVDIVQLVSCLMQVLEELGNPDHSLMYDLETIQNDLNDNEYSSSEYNDDYFDSGFRRSDVGLAYMAVVRMVSSEIYKPGKSSGKLKEYIDRLKLLLSESHQAGINLRLDVHAGNFMFRRTKYGVQLVVSDPVIIRGKNK